MLRRISERARSERGQLLLMMVLIMTVIFIVGSVAIDLSLWLSERRGAQKDADLSSIAAAQPLLALLHSTDAGASALEQTANDRADTFAQDNGVTDLANAHTPVVGDDCRSGGSGCTSPWTDCWSDQQSGTQSLLIDSYPLDIAHPSRSLFSRIFGFAAPKDLGAHARACVGSVITMKGVMPIGVPINDADFHDPTRVLCWSTDQNGDGLPDPLYGKECDLSVTAKISGEASWLDLDPGVPTPTTYCHNESGGGGNNLTTIIEAGGAQTTCRIAPGGSTCPVSLSPSDPNYCVESKTGLLAGPVMKAFNKLFSTEGSCDGTGDGIDDFSTSIQLVSGTPETPSAFYKVICDSPRLVTLIIVDQFINQGNGAMPIRAFASFFVEACTSTDNNGVVSTYPKCDPRGSIGQFNLVGRFVNILGEGAVGPPTDFSPKRIVLDQ